MSRNEIARTWLAISDIIESIDFPQTGKTSEKAQEKQMNRRNEANCKIGRKVNHRHPVSRMVKQLTKDLPQTEELLTMN
jgi:recombinational DNA repair ATPase RecF